MNQLFPTDDIQPTTTPNEPPPLYVKRRLRTPVRDQMLMRPASLDQELPQDHPVRLVWTLVEKIDFSQWLKLLRAVEGSPGRAGNDPRLLLAIWVFATVEGESSARRVDTLCREHVAYKWLCGALGMVVGWMSAVEKSWFKSGLRVRDLSALL